MLMVGVSVVLGADLLAAETPAARATTQTLNGSALSLGLALGAALGGLALSLGGYPAIGLCALGFTLAAAWLVAWSRPSEMPAVTRQSGRADVL
jgi:predicted MFS family arabinose efflux permease